MLTAIWLGATEVPWRYQGPSSSQAHLGWLPKAPKKGRACSAPTPGPGFMSRGSSLGGWEAEAEGKGLGAAGPHGLPSEPEAPAASYLLQAVGKTHPAPHPVLRGRLRGPSLALQRC